MTTLLLVRHGESIANRREIFCGQSDYDLTETGFAQAKCTAEYIAAHYSVSHVYASTLSRAYHTGENIAALAHCPITPEPRLREIFCGEWEEAPFSEMLTRWPDSYIVWLRDIGHVQCPGGENVPQVLARAMAALQEIVQRHPDETVVIATHGTVIRALMCTLAGRDLSEMKEIPWARNASVTEVLCDGDAWKIAGSDYDGHLGNLSTSLPDTV